jgi:hypothetical protein
MLTEDLNQRWYGCVTGRRCPGRYIVALCYATSVILLGWWPWNVLLILPALLSRNHNHVRFSVFATPEESVGSNLFCLRGGSL